MDVLIVAVVMVTVFVGVTMIGNFWIQAPALPSSASVARAMAELADLRPGDRVYDLGAGYGEVLLAAVRREPRILATGVELLPTLWLLGILRMWCLREKMALLCGDFFRTDLRDADVVFLYQTPSVLHRLLPKLHSELRPGTRVISHTFALPGRTPDREVRVPALLGPVTLRRYRW